LGDSPPDFSSFHTLIYSLFISSSADRVATIQTFTWPWLAIGAALQKLTVSPDVDLVVNLVLGFYYCALLALSWRHLRGGDRLFCLVNTLVSLSYATGPEHPYMGLPRHLLLAAPVFIGAARALGKKTAFALHAVGFLGMLFLLMLYVFESWVP
jgi:hypothetical protein